VRLRPGILVRPRLKPVIRETVRQTRVNMRLRQLRVTLVRLGVARLTL
jgi:hypothetical protein